MVEDLTKGAGGDAGWLEMDEYYYLSGEYPDDGMFSIREAMLWRVSYLTEISASGWKVISGN